ncbi:MAG: hypothetical protein ACTSU4_00645 [Promethearchaeota archaeon]
MHFSDFANKLKDKIEKEKKYKDKEFLFPDEKLELTKHKKIEAKQKIKTLSDDRKFLKTLLRMIESGATGFELAYFVEKNQKIKHLIYDGKFFYNTFLNTGNKRFINLPDKTIKSYDNFKTVEETEKYLFMLWLKEKLAEMEETIDVEKEYMKYEEKKYEDSSKLMYCPECGARVREKNQLYCEFCGARL